MKVLCLIVLCLTFSFAEGSVEEILQRLTCRCRDSQSDSVLVTQNGRVIFEYRSDPYWQPIDTSSITKSIVALAIGMLIDEERIASIDEPVYHFFPEWDQGRKRDITIRHLLNNTSGLQSGCTDEEIYRTSSIIQLALCAELTSTPGTCYFSNNKAINLLTGIVKRASGRSLSEYLAVKMFAPMGIDNVSWLSDPCGNEYAMSHMIITAPDLVKIGEMLVNGGLYCGRRIVSKCWIDLLTCPGQHIEPFCGMLWWMDYYNVECWWDDALLQQYGYAGISPQFVGALRSLNGRVMDMNGCVRTPWGSNFFNGETVDLLGGNECAESFMWQVRQQGYPVARWRAGSMKSFSARGYLGQQLIIFPGRKIVAVRQTRSRGVDDDQVDLFHDFGALVEELSYKMGPY